MTRPPTAGADHPPRPVAPLDAAAPSRVQSVGPEILRADIPPVAGRDDETTGPCPNCDAPMHAIRGSKRAVCANCGFKDSCCF